MLQSIQHLGAMLNCSQYEITFMYIYDYDKYNGHETNIIAKIRCKQRSMEVPTNTHTHIESMYVLLQEINL